jgi:hypothetical protein
MAATAGCERCKREVPEPSSPEVLAWVNVPLSDGNAIICPDCAALPESEVTQQLEDERRRARFPDPSGDVLNAIDGKAKVFADCTAADRERSEERARNAGVTS